MRTDNGLDRPSVTWRPSSRSLTFGILFVVIALMHSVDCSRIPYVNSVSFFWGSGGGDVSSQASSDEEEPDRGEDVDDKVCTEEEDGDEVTSEALDANASTTETTSTSSNSTNDEEEDEEEAVRQPLRLEWFPGGLHDLNDELHSEMVLDDYIELEETSASDTDEDEEETKDNFETSVEDDRETTSEVIEPGNVTQKSSSQDEGKIANPTRRGQSLAPLETDKVSPSSVRMLEDDIDDEEDYGNTREGSNAASANNATALSEAINDRFVNDPESESTEVPDTDQAAWNRSEVSLCDNSSSNATSQVSPRKKSFFLFRGIRKGTARVTGFHGFFSKKYTASNATEDVEDSDSPLPDNVNLGDGFHQSNDSTTTSLVTAEDAELDGTIVKPSQDRLLLDIDEDDEESDDESDDTSPSQVMDKEPNQVNEVEAETPVEVDAIPDDESETGHPRQAEKNNLAVSNAVSPYESSGFWRPVDFVVTLGFSTLHRSLRPSRYFRGTRKVVAGVTGLHGLLSGKPLPPVNISADESDIADSETRLQKSISAIDRARRNLPEGRRGLFRRFGQKFLDLSQNAKEEIMKKRKLARVKEIDRLHAEYQGRIQDLLCEKDMLQERPNPLWNYTSEEGPALLDINVSVKEEENLVEASRMFNFPPQELVDDYLEMLFLSERLVKLNHTDLWRVIDDSEDDDDLLDDFGSPHRRKKTKQGNGRSNGNWFLRNGLGQKIGEAVEKAAYTSVCKALMSVLSRSISSIHGLNVMEHSDIRLAMEQTPTLPPLSAGMIPGSSANSDYAKRALQGVMFRGASKNKRRRRRHRRSRNNDFLQRAAITETLLSHATISAPLLQLFPLAWQRELLSNIIIMATSIISDFCQGLEFQILGHRLCFSFTPITEEDMLRGIASFHQRRSNPDQIEAAIQATAADLSRELRFLDKWHERALGSDMLRSQIANLIARLVIHLVDDLLRGARLDLWAATGGPQLKAGLEFRTDT